MRLVLEIKNVASFITTRFYLKGGCTKIREHAETLHTNTGCKMAIVFLYRKKRNLGCNFQTLFARKRDLAHSDILYSILSYFITLS